MPVKKSVIYTAAFAAVVTIVLLIGLAVLPAIVEPVLQNRLPGIAQQYPVEFKIEKLGISSTYISDIRVTEGISVDGIDIRYAISFSRTPRVKKIIVSGLTIHAQLDKDNQIQIGGVNVSASSEQKKPMDISPFLPYLPEKFVLKNAKLVLNIKGQVFLIPLEALSTIQADNGKVSLLASVYPFGEKIDAQVDYDLEKGVERVKIDGKAFDSGHLGRFISKITDSARIAGPIDFSLFSSAPQKKWDLAVSQVSVKDPLNVRVDKIRATALIENQKVLVQGDFKLQSRQIPLIPVEYTAGFDLKNLGVFDVDIKTGDMSTLDIPQASGNLSLVSPQVTARFNGTPEAVAGNININCKTGMFILKDQKLSFKNALLHLNVNTAPADKKNKIQIKGSFNVPHIAYNQEHVFSTKGNIVQTDQKQFAVAGALNIDALKQVKTEFKIHIGLEDKLKIAAQFDAPPFKLTHNDIKKWMPQNMKSGKFDVMASISGSADWTDNTLKTAMTLDLKNGNVHLPDTKLTASGINTSMQFNDLLVPETLPGQTLTIDSVVVSKVNISDVKLRFSVEDGASVLAENIRFKWCNGTVTTEAIRLPQETDGYALSLYCDRLEMTQLLAQIGAFKAEGKGTLNGRIPIRYKNGDIFFDNGFLFSTPGSGGKIKVSNTDVITAGIPLDSPQFSELDLAREALKSFNYQWAKISFNTAGDILSVNMELDGKPTGVMPFEYKKEVGRFIRVDTKSPGSNFQGIKLDVNLNLPFNEVMKFGNKLKAFLK
ncbi:MAG: YdbH domain-containing protein [Proteobacteria bacterium]|nr:YdbH domain-containing protein [Pseudomonadota bacterium]MBU1388784.1 YdbH domain-containing protein [Pseudomonadota bacterium]MBU1543125.1 YdbH domain-containing protein [Pseudomonadota bacterium]MBU2481715.1 YdbH domain-containing protein [Pseudomonadota bacterium]